MEVPQLVSITIFSSFPLRLYPIYFVGVHIVAYEWYFYLSVLFTISDY